MVAGVVWSSEDAHGPQHRLHIANRISCSRVPGATPRVEYLAESGNQDLFKVGERETPVYCETGGRGEVGWVLGYGLEQLTCWMAGLELN
eukprot:1194259-Prorocentrum_minimum.AAC.4